MHAQACDMGDCATALKARDMAALRTIPKADMYSHWGQQRGRTMATPCSPQEHTGMQQAPETKRFRGFAVRKRQASPAPCPVQRSPQAMRRDAGAAVGRY